MKLSGLMLVYTRRNFQEKSLHQNRGWGKCASQNDFSRLFRKIYDFFFWNNCSVKNYSAHLICDKIVLLIFIVRSLLPLTNVYLTTNFFRLGNITFLQKKKQFNETLSLFDQSRFLCGFMNLVSVSRIWLFVLAVFVLVSLNVAVRFVRIRS